MMSLKKDDEADPTYEPGTITSFHRGIGRMLRHRGYKEDIQTSPYFKNSRDVLVAKRKLCKADGKFIDCYFKMLIFFMSSLLYIQYVNWQ